MNEIKQEWVLSDEAFQALREKSRAEGRREVIMRLKILDKNHNCCKDFDEAVQELIHELEQPEPKK